MTNRLIAAIQGMQLASMGRFITQYDPLARRYAAAEVASALKWTTRAAASRLEWGEHLTSTLPRTLAALCAGIIDIAKARTMIEQTEIIDADDGMAWLSALLPAEKTALADYVRANAPTCIFPCCNRPARSCELDHTVPFPDGPTSADNLKPLCKYHHEAKTHHGWDVTQVTYAWTSPLGRTYVTYSTGTNNS
ncbi:HNH endonuclease signature motif containing protein [Fodinicola acaciae]|uniref:HNH endonuclease signature motif containing protein n=1 Tax=Fodinicola acaciae TaxID=2681555 RepID=UPI0013D01349|nr:HNH endonuclease signature motif containing protein [Fodinicola acaciae]